jgi:AraC-like DNA-binding protein
MPRPQTIIRDVARGDWEMESAAPHVSLRAHVRRYTGWFERHATPFYRRELPGHTAPVIVNFGAPIRVFEAADSTRSRLYGSFATGAYDSYVLVEASGSQGGIQIDFTILGMRLFLGRPRGDLSNRAVDLEDVFGPSTRQLTMELHDAPTWDARFDILDREIAGRMTACRAPREEVRWLWTRLLGCDGRVSMGSLAAEAGWSRKHLIAQFKEQIGLPPKVLARVLRFHRAVDALRRGSDVRLADVAADCGYYDQPHFDRDFHAFAGVTPSELVRSLRADGGFSADR